MNETTSNCRVVRYGPAESVATRNSSPVGTDHTRIPKPGDFILTHAAGIFPLLIRAGQALRYRGRDAIYAHWSHTAVFINDAGDLIEALGGGVQQCNISRYAGTEYVVVYLPAASTALDRREAVAFAEYCLNDAYGWLTLVSILLCLLTGGKIGFGVDGQQICSGLVARCLERFGIIFTEGDPWRLMPADLAWHFKVHDVGDKGIPPQPDAGVVRASKPGRKRP